MISLLSQAKPKANLLSTDYPHLIAIEWRPGGLAALAFTQQQSTLSLVKEAERSWSEQALAGGLEAKAGELIQFLTTSGFVDASQSTAMVVAIDPALVISKRFELPLLPEIAIHDAVMLELESRGIGPIDYVSDYVVHRPHPADHLVISSISAPRDLVQRLEQVSEQLDCALLSLTLGEFSLLPAMRPEPTQDAATVLMVADRQFLQLVLTCGHRPLAEFRFPYPNSPLLVPQLVRASLERLLQALPAPLMPSDFHKTPIVGELANELAKVLQSSDYSPIEVSILQAPKRAWRAWGAAQSIIARRETFNLKYPKQGVDRAAIAQAKRLRLALWAASMLALLGYSLFEYHRQLDQRTRDLQTQISRADRTLERERTVMDAASLLANWERLPLQLTTQLPQALTALPNHDRAFLTGLQIDQGEEEQAELRLEGLARQLEDALGIAERMVQQGYEMRPHRIDHYEADPHYGTRFTVTAKVSAVDVVTSKPSAEADSSSSANAEAHLISRELP